MDLLILDAVIASAGMNKDGAMVVFDPDHISIDVANCGLMGAGTISRDRIAYRTRHFAVFSRKEST